MYRIEYCQKDLHALAKNKAHIEASITEAYMLKEISHFSSIYFEENVPTVHNPTPRYNIGIEQNDCQLSLFTGRRDTTSRGTPRVLSDLEWRTAMLYVITNLSEVDDYVSEFVRLEWKQVGEPTRKQTEKLLKDGARHGHPNFVSWFYQKSLKDRSMSDELRQVSKGCHPRMLSYSTYDVNGYRFRTAKHEMEIPNATIINSGLVTIGQDANNASVEYYGITEEIIELTFQGKKPFNLVLFKCHWFHPFRRVRREDSYGLVEVAHETVLPGFEPFVVAQQAIQVYYIPYPCKSLRNLADWWVVYKVQPPGRLPTPVEQDYCNNPSNGGEAFFQEDGLPGTFEINIGGDEDHIDHIPREAEEVVDEQDLELLNRINIDSTEHEEEELILPSSDTDDELLGGPEQVDPILDDYF